MLAAAYIRVSTEDQAEQGISIPAQKSRLLSYCQAQGWEIYEYYIDDGYSGKDLDRPAMQRLIEDIKNRKIDTVLVLKLDRLSRRQRHILDLLEEVFEPYEVGFKSVTESFDTTTAFGKAALGMMAVFAQLERETIIERVRMAKKESAKQGRFMGGIAPYGYKYDSEKKSLLVDDIRAQTVKWMYKEYLDGKHGYQNIGEELERRGVPGPKGKGWNRQAVRKILTNPVYAGLVGHRGNVYQGKHEPIIEPEKWREVRSLIQSRGAVRDAGNEHSGLLQGIIWCGECGARMRAKNTWQNYPCTDPKKIIRYYVCYSRDGSSKHMVRKAGCACGYKHAGEIENKVLLDLYRHSSEKELIHYVINEAGAKKTDVESLLRQTNQAGKNIQTIDKKLERWYTAFEEGILDPAGFMDRIRGLRAEKIFFQEYISEIENRLKEEDNHQADTLEFIKIMENLPAIWEEADEAEKRGIIANIVRAVRIYADNRIEVDFYI